MKKSDILPDFDQNACDSLVIEIERVEGVDNSLAMRLQGHIDTYSSLFFQRSAKKAIDAGFTNLIFLLKGVDYVSSMGVGAFMQLQKAAREKGGDIAMAEINPKVREIFRLMCLEKFFSCSDSLEEAVAPLLQGERPLFPRTMQCPVCDKKLRASKPGTFRCPHCKTVMGVDGFGAVVSNDD
jgi:anti-anti-sigma factor